jgi:CPA2 family monovalent cation:H+ antiporter-2
MVAAKALLSALTTRAFVPSNFKALRTGLVLAGGGEFGVALLTLLAQGRDLVPARAAQLLLATVVLGMIVSPLIIRYNRRIARLLLVETAPPRPAMQREDLAATELARREHVILCGFGRVGRHLARVLESQGFEYLAMDLDPANVRAARQAGEPVVWGDSSDEELLRSLGMDAASVVSSLPSPIPGSLSAWCGRCAVCAPMCRCWCAPRMIRGWQSCPRLAPPRWCPKPSRPA